MRKKYGFLLAVITCFWICRSACTQKAAQAEETLLKASSNRAKDWAEENSPNPEVFETQCNLRAEDAEIKSQMETSPHMVVEKMAANPGKYSEKIEIGPSVDNLEEKFVCVKDYIPDIVEDLKYATTDNFTGQKIYDFTKAYLRYGTMKKLEKAQNMARERGMVLKIWDAYRPVAAQFDLWNICPDPVYVADPNQGYSSHSRGNTVDITLVYENGIPVEMPTDFDDFSPLADRDYSDCPEAAAQNAQLLENIMTECGFEPYWGEWWHFSDEESYEVEKEFEP